ncbi:MAG: cob(I)yrinic acid a,c-diamide adenosyltransferase [Clostridia bacterium]|nr:cob(I)yrinic acid a,c-diamide adenosyltransferase [Clostridia bacterium]
MIHKLHVYTGDGKGKTTASMGLALRSLGHGQTVLIAQFMKDGTSGELNALRTFPDAVVMTAPPISGFTFRMTPDELADTVRLQTAFAQSVLSCIESTHPDTIILDELAVAMSLKTVDPDMADALISAALAAGETVVTGRNAPEALLSRADYISRILAERHPFITEKLGARKGVEW